MLKKYRAVVPIRACLLSNKDKGHVIKMFGDIPLYQYYSKDS